ncbi:CaiB/BaiF CoA transferase family protein [Acinetobacter indicus]|uniref:CaiB/BaiF CoA transferase family protein n=1 Tax=Acinetobacter indicus TaxID=756892 RepID=UPI000FDA3BA4|nr:CaiB/BaiF CoA-transferase family protein [Acinetobacter indicus]RVT47268.1 CoA transferase [Acinetobacter indicus]UNW03000.1 CoA transferase [Acinetobacter indicus]
MGALTGFRVLDLSRILAGPWCSQILADLGAEVIKIEKPDHGDDTRIWGPPWLKNNQQQDTHESAYYLSANRGKHSVAVDLSTPEGQQIIKKIAETSDVVIENYKASSLKKYGLDYESLSHINPRLVYCSITGFGQHGPRAHEPGYDFIIQGMGGMMSVTGERDDLPGGGPQKAGLAFADLTTGLYSAIAIQAALLSREKTGEGQHIDMALLDTQVASLSVLAMNYLTSGKVPGRFGNAHANIVPYQVFKAQEGEFIIACGNDQQFLALCDAIGLPEVPKDPRFSRNSGRVMHREEVTQILQQHFYTQPAKTWVDLIHAVKVPVGMINNLQQTLEEEQVLAREMVIQMPHTLREDYTSIGSPIKLSKTPVEYKKAPPCLGEDTDNILSQFLSAEEMQTYKAKKIIQQR